MKSGDHRAADLLPIIADNPNAQAAERISHLTRAGHFASRRGIKAWAERPGSQYRQLVEDFASDDVREVRAAALAALEAVDGQPQIHRLYENVRDNLGIDGVDGQTAPWLEELQAAGEAGLKYVESRLECGDDEEERQAFLILQALRRPVITG